MRALDTYFQETSKERDDLIQAFMIVKRLDEVQKHRWAVFHIKESKTLKGSWKTTVRERIVAGSRSKSFVVRVTSGWNRIPGEAV